MQTYFLRSTLFSEFPLQLALVLSLLRTNLLPITNQGLYHHHGDSVIGLNEDDNVATITRINNLYNDYMHSEFSVKHISLFNNVMSMRNYYDLNSGLASQSNVSAYVLMTEEVDNNSNLNMSLSSQYYVPENARSIPDGIASSPSDLDLMVEEMDLIDVLWKQDIDLGVRREEFEQGIKDDTVMIKEERGGGGDEPSDYVKEIPDISNPYSQFNCTPQNCTIDNETGEHVVLDFERHNTPPSLHQSGMSKSGGLQLSSAMKGEDVFLGNNINIEDSRMNSLWDDVESVITSDLHSQHLTWRDLDDDDVSLSTPTSSPPLPYTSTFPAAATTSISLVNNNFTQLQPTSGLFLDEGWAEDDVLLGLDNLLQELPIQSQQPIDVSIPMETEAVSPSDQQPDEVLLFNNLTTIYNNSRGNRTSPVVPWTSSNETENRYRHIEFNHTYSQLPSTASVTNYDDEEDEDDEEEDSGYYISAADMAASTSQWSRRPRVRTHSVASSSNSGDSGISSAYDDNGSVRRKKIYSSHKQRASYDDAASRNRDVEKAVKLGLPYTVHNIVASPLDEYQKMLCNTKLNNEQLQLIKDIRRRGKNKLAAQNCRKRKIDYINVLQDEIDRLRNRKANLVQSSHTLDRRLDEMNERYRRLEYETLRYLGEVDEQTYSPQHYTISEDDDGNLCVVPRHHSDDDSDESDDDA